MGLTLVLKSFPVRYRSAVNVAPIRTQDVYRPHYPFHHVHGRFVVRTAADGEDLEKVLRLRHAVFYDELLRRRTADGLDRDAYDSKADHLMVEEAATGMLLGTYRVLSSRHVRAFYSQSEFKMRGLLNLPGSKLELGRACVHPEHRNGVTITLLWRGISEYLKASRADYLFGCSSIKCTDPERVNLVYRYLATRHASSEEARVLPRRKFRYPGLDRVPEFPALDEVEVARARELVPSLLHAYLKAGARGCGQPALDRDFQCVDFLTLLDVKQLDAAVERKYAVC